MLAYDKPRDRFYRYEYSFERGANHETGMLRPEDLRELVVAVLTADGPGDRFYLRASVHLR